MGIPMFIAVLFTVAKIWKQSKCLSMDKWIKMWYIYTVEHCSAMRKKELLPFGTIWTKHGTPLQYSCLENPMDRGA